MATSKAEDEIPMAKPLLQAWATFLAEVKSMLIGMHCRIAIKKVVMIQAQTIAIAIQEAILKARTRKIVR